MARKRLAYTLRYGESTHNDMLVYFDDDETIYENLTRIIPSAIQRGFLPAECSADSVKLVFDGRQLNLNVPFGKQAFAIPERAILNILDRSSTVRIRVAYTPDNYGERSDAVYVNPNKLLGDELKKFLAGVSKEYRFYRRRAKKFKLVSDGNSVKLNKTLTAQNIEVGFDANLLPRLFFRWPPGKLAIGSLVSILVLLVAFVVWRTWPEPPPEPITAFHVFITTDVDAKLKLTASDTTVTMVPDSTFELTFRPGINDYEVLPRDFPIFSDRMTLSEFAATDTAFINLNIQGRFSSAEPIKFLVKGYWDRERTSTRILDQLKINGYDRPEEPFLGETSVTLPRGEYEMRYPINDDLFMADKLDCPPEILRGEKLRFDFSEYDKSETPRVILFYRSSM